MDSRPRSGPGSDAGGECPSLCSLSGPCPPPLPCLAPPIAAHAAFPCRSEFTDTILSVHPSDVLDMPVDPNEPTYCLCHQVSYGEMIGCDNPDVSVSARPGGLCRRTWGLEMGFPDAGIQGGRLGRGLVWGRGLWGGASCGRGLVWGGAWGGAGRGRAGGLCLSLCPAAQS